MQAEGEADLFGFPLFLLLRVPPDGNAKVDSVFNVRTFRND